jgi:hypothetical protein
MYAKMKQHIPVVAALSIGAFMILTLWDVTANGLFETSSFDVDHFESGAGSLTLLMRFAFCIASLVILVVWIPDSFKLKPVFLKISAAVFIVFVFIWSVAGLERFGDQYDEKTFIQIMNHFRSGSYVDMTQVQEMLGEPLVSEKRFDGGETWLYSYMPSCGFGWAKRAVCFDSNGEMTGWLYSDEP